MSMQITGMKRLRANYYNKILIRENPIYGRYIVEISGEDSCVKTLPVGERFMGGFKDLSEEDKILEIIRDYLNNTKVNAITDPISSEYGRLYNIVYGNLGYKQLMIQLFNPKFKGILKSIQTKYYEDRYDFCYEGRGLKTYRIEASSYETSYDIELSKLHRGALEEEYFKLLKLKTKDMKVLESEKRFIKEFIINVFSKYNEEICVEKVYNKKYEFTANDVVGYLLKCGDVKIYVPKFEPLYFILTVVKNYNLQIKQSKEMVKMRQLKMEEF